MLCSEGSVYSEINTLKNTLPNNGYPDNSVGKFLVEDTERTGNRDSDSKKNLYLKLHFEGDIAGNILTRRLKKSVEKTFYIARSHIIFLTKPPLRQQIKLRLPMMDSSMCVFQFSCFGGPSYISRTQRTLSLRVSEHVPVWLGKGITKSTSSTILPHLADSEHHTKIYEVFPVLYHVPKKLP